MDSMNSKDALFALDTTMQEDMDDYGKEITMLVVKHINSTPKLYRFVKENQKNGLSIKDSAIAWARQNGDEFGDVFITELDSQPDVVDWTEVDRLV